jgi:8-oxo-dGTP diphosphatase
MNFGPKKILRNVLNTNNGFVCMEKWVEGIAFIILKDGKVLVEKRKMNKKVDPGRIIIPGGHVEEGENALDACKKELKEELGIQCKRIDFVVRLPYIHPVEKQNINYYLCRDIIGKIETNEAEEVFWINPVTEKNVLSTDTNDDVDLRALEKMLELIKNEKKDE